MANILYVEDEPVVATPLMKLLSAWGHTVTHAATAEEGLREFKQNPQGFDLIISDYDLGAGMNGVALAEKISETSEGRTPRFMLYTSRTWDQIEQTQGLPAAGKPITKHLIKGNPKLLKDAITELTTSKDRGEFQLE